jgi:ribosomal protein S18 acetylase RimI-like enzyme
MIKLFKPEEWETYKSDILNIESKCFPSELAMNEEEVKRDCCSEDSIVLLAFEDDRLVGAMYAGSLNDKDTEWLDGCWNPQTYEHIKEKVAYISSIGVLPEYQNRGIAKKFKENMNQILKKLGYRYVLSHSNEGAMTHLDELFGAKIIDTKHNWGGSKETHHLTETKL